MRVDSTWLSQAPNEHHFLDPEFNSNVLRVVKRLRSEFFISNVTIAPRLWMAAHYGDNSAAPMINVIDAYNFYITKIMKSLNTAKSLIATTIAHNSAYCQKLWLFNTENQIAGYTYARVTSDTTDIRHHKRNQLSHVGTNDCRTSIRT